MLPGVVPAAVASDVAVVVQPNLPVDDLTFAELRKILMGERQFWPSNVRVTLLIRAPVAHERDIVIKNILQMTEAQFSQYWISKVFRAESATSPKTVYTNEIAASLVSNIPGSIATSPAAARLTCWPASPTAGTTRVWRGPISPRR